MLKEYSNLIYSHNAYKKMSACPIGVLMVDRVLDIDGRRIRTHNPKTTDGKTFVTFIACVIRVYMLNRLSKYLTDKSTSMKKVFSQLSNITLISSHDKYRFTKALSKKQKEMLEKFDASDDIIKSINENTSKLKN
jgi:hypothetical protein